MDFYNFFSFSAKKAIYRASEMCVQFSNEHLEPEHILYSIMNLRSCSAMQVLHQLGINVPKLNYSIEAFLYEHAGSFKGTASFSARTLTLMDSAYKEVYRLHHREIGTTHLLVALAEDRSEFLRQLFSEHRLNAKRIRETYMTHLKGYAAETHIPGGVSEAPGGVRGKAYDTEVSEILRLAAFLARRLKHPQILLPHMFYAFSTRDRALTYISNTWGLGKLRPSCVLKLIAAELDRLDPDQSVTKPGMGDDAMAVLSSALKQSVDKHEIAAVEIAEFSRALLEHTEVQFKSLLSQCVVEDDSTPDSEAGLSDS